MQNSHVDYNDKKIISPFMNYNSQMNTNVSPQPHQEVVNFHNPQEILRNKIRNDRLMMF